MPFLTRAQKSRREFLRRKSQKYPLLQDLEENTGRVVTIDTITNAKSCAKCNLQGQSPLFGTLPPEIRNVIYAFTLAPFDDPDRPCAETDYRYSGHRAHRITSLTLLLTCRRVWPEANHYAIRQAEHYFCLRYDHFYQLSWIRQNYLSSFDCLTPNQHPLLDHVQMHVNICIFRECSNVTLPQLAPPWPLPRFTMRKLTMTIGRRDWWTITEEPDAPVAFEPLWLLNFLHCIADSPRLETFRLKLEVSEPRVMELQALISDLRARCRAREEEAPQAFVLEEPIVEQRWPGPTNLGEQEHELYRGIPRLGHRMFALKWKRALPLPDREELYAQVAVPEINVDELSPREKAKELKRRSMVSGVTERWRGEGSLLRCSHLPAEAPMPYQTRSVRRRLGRKATRELMKSVGL